MEYRRCEKPTPDTSIDLSGLGGPCDVYKAMQNKIKAIKDCRVVGPLCDPTRFEVQFQLTDASSYMFVITDNETGEQVGYSVRKEFPKESAQRAFERDWIESAIRYNSGVVRALEDHLEALQLAEPDAGFHLRNVCGGFGYQIYRPISPGMDVIPFKLDFVPIKGVITDPPTMEPRIWDVIGNVPGEQGRSLARLITRLMRLGVSFTSVEETAISEYYNWTIQGWVKRNDDSHIQVILTHQGNALSDEQLAAYHEYYDL
jgi:hypothetical protein